MMKMYRMSGEADGYPGMPDEVTLVLNSASPLVRRLGDKAAASEGDALAEGEAEAAVKRLYMLATMAQRRLNAGEMKDFLADAYGMIEKAL